MEIREQFLPRDAMRKRGLCCGPVSVRPSVCLSVTLVHCIHGWRYRQTSLSARYGSPIILVFWLPGADTQFQGEPLRRGRKIQGVGNFFAIFDWNRRLSRKRYEVGPWLLWNVNKKSYALYRMVIIVIDLDGSLTRFLRSRHIWSRNLKHSASYGQSYYRTLTVKHTQSIERYHFRWPWLALDWDFKVAIFSTLNISETTRDRAIVTIERQ